MAVVEVSISSCCTIKPSSATPPHLRTWKLSMLDQIFPNFHVPFILLYSPSSSHPPAAIVAHLKLSLSHALTKYYPLAGRLDEPKYTVDCCDQGINFFEAQAHGNLLRNPGPDLRRQLAPPAGGNTTGYLEGVLLAVQVTVFNCGGVSLGLSISHKIADGVSLFSFLRTWATSTTTRNIWERSKSSSSINTSGVLPASGFDAGTYFLQGDFRYVVLLVVGVSFLCMRLTSGGGSQHARHLGGL